jgi:hypothetical protein
MTATPGKQEVTQQTFLADISTEDHKANSWLLHQTAESELQSAVQEPTPPKQKTRLPMVCVSAL